MKVLCTLFLLLSFWSLEAQKNNLTFGLSGFANFDKILHLENGTRIDGEIDIQSNFGWFVTPKIVVGGGFGFQHLKRERFSISVSPSQTPRELDKTTKISIPLFFKYYFTESKVRPYYIIRLKGQRRSMSEIYIGVTQKEHDFEFINELGIGLEYFITKNIALQTEFNYRLIGSEYYGDYQWTPNPKSFYMVGIQAFTDFKKESKNKFRAIDSYFQKGNLFIGLNGRASLYSKKEYEKFTQIEGDVQYFLNKNLAIESQFHFSKEQFNSDFNLFNVRYGMSAGLRGFSSMSKNITASINGYLGSFRTDKDDLFFTTPPIVFGQIPDGSRTLTQYEFATGIGSDFYFFLHKWLLKIGISADYQRLNLEDSFFSELEIKDEYLNTLMVSPHFSVEYFVEKNIAVGGKMSYGLYDWESASFDIAINRNEGQIRRVQMNFGLRYFVFQ